MYKVVVDYDGCTNWEVDLPQARGTREECMSFVARHLPPKGCEFGIVDLSSGRQVSFMVQFAARRVRLIMQDCKEIS